MRESTKYAIAALLFAIATAFIATHFKGAISVLVYLVTFFATIAMFLLYLDSTEG